MVVPCYKFNIIYNICLCRYDKHREEILRGAGSDYKDDSVNLMPYFSASIFTGYGDDPKVLNIRIRFLYHVTAYTTTAVIFFILLNISIQGFYAVYGDVFRRIASEEAQYREAAGAKDHEQLPEFGMSL